MVSINSGPSDVNKDLQGQVDAILPEAMVAQRPVVIAGVQRKINIGNFENIDVYAAVAMPVDVDVTIDTDALNAVLSEKLDNLIMITSAKTGEKYNLVKDNIPEWLLQIHKV